MPRGLRLVRIQQIAAIVLGCFVLLGARLFHLQILCGSRYRQQQSRQVVDHQEVPGRRGRILDRNGRVLAFDVVAFDVSVLKRQVRAQDLELLARALGKSKRDLQLSLRGNERYVTLGRQVTLSPQLVHRLGSLPGVCLTRRSFRVYPFGTLAGPYLGFTAADGHGAEGVEKAFDAALRGTPGEVVLLRDEDGAPVGQVSCREPVDGADIALAMDADLQRIADDELQRAIDESGARGGSVLILDPHTADLLACSSAPGPATRGGDYEPSCWRNRAVYDLFEPGSTLKPVTVVAALRSGVARPNTWIYAEHGSKNFGVAVVRDAHEGGDGWLTFTQAFAQSSNICFAKLARALSSAALYQELRDFGFGGASGVELPGEPCGVLSLPRDWSGRTRLTLGYGQEISVTALQLAGLYTAIANGGCLLQPRVALRLQDAAGRMEENPVRQVRRVLDPALADVVRDMCSRVVAEGTGVRAGLEGLDVAGKTGTAQKAVDGRYAARFVASFAGFVPAASPRIVCLVVLDEPRGNYHWGGQSAAPTFRRIVEAMLRSTRYLQPDPAAIQVVRGRDLAPEAGLESPLRLATVAGPALPDLRGMDLRVASRWLQRMGVESHAEGRGVVRAQQPAPGVRLARGDVVRLRCQPARQRASRAAVLPAP
jgi:cell division protein FtsI (penicillin-binding protein 3)